MKTNMVTELNRVLKKAVMSSMLKQAVEETIKALKAGNFDLACQISSCKSLICSGMDTKPDEYYTIKEYAFREDAEANRKALNDEDVYEIMDSVHFECAMRTGNTPSGMMVMSTNGIQEMKRDEIDHPIVERIKLERIDIRDAVRKQSEAKYGSVEA
jgi:hypothetical protein